MFSTDDRDTVDFEPPEESDTSQTLVCWPLGAGCVDATCDAEPGVGAPIGAGPDGGGGCEPSGGGGLPAGGGGLPGGGGAAP